MIEQVIADNTAALRDLIACWKGMAQALAAPSTTPVLDVVAGRPADPTIAENIGKAAGIVAELAVSSTPAAPLAAEAGAIATATVTDVLTAATQLIAAKGKPALADALKPFNVTSIKAISQEKLVEALGAIQTALAA